ncbi:MAG: hypothetical protein NZ954_02195 [Thermofilaceae archaeon]|nr:hypothetical protein [Thermofilaceae archaeon]MCX8180919.1 hypothetical protein [Thermofilaceae archaeon]MDW8003484.1 hypothetical protein [Thermofilaceae archaeon]
MDVHVKVHVEADVQTLEYKGAVVYVTSTEPLEGCELTLKFKKGVAVTGCLPHWPNRIEENEASWKVLFYPRIFEDRILHSFGVRLDLKGYVKLTAKVTKWNLNGCLVELEAARDAGLKAVVGPLASKYRIVDFKGSLNTVSSLNLSYILVEGSYVNLVLETFEQGMLAGHLEYEPSPVEIPFKLTLTGLNNNYRVSKYLLARLKDLYG